MFLVNTNRLMCLAALSIIAVCSGRGLAAQSAPPLPPPAVAEQPLRAPEREFCVQGRPIQQCRSFAIIELPFGYRLAHTNPSIVGNGNAFVGLELGRMVNQSRTRAIGASVAAASSGGDSHFSINARSRRWLTEQSYGDASLGVLAAGIHGRPMAYGLTGSVGLGYSDIIGIWAGADVAPIGGPRHAALHAGVRFGSYATMTTVGLAVALLAVLGTGWNEGTY